MIDPTTIATGLVGAGAGALAMWKRTGAETESLTVATMRVVIEELRTELDRKQSEMKSMRRQLDKLDRSLNLLTHLPQSHLS